MKQFEVCQQDEVCLKDGTSIEGELGEPRIGWMRDKGVWVSNAHRSAVDGNIPIGSTVFVPYESMLFIVLEP